MPQDKAQTLFLAILALDSYNRGYLPGYTVVADRNKIAIGDATLSTPSDPLNQSVAFFAQSYDWRFDSVVNNVVTTVDKKVISYRGTTFELGINTTLDGVSLADHLPIICPSFD